jgi:hypothetical protein
VVVTDRVVGGAAVVGGALVVVGGLGPMVCAALAGGRLVGGAVAAVVGAAAGAGAWLRGVELVVLDRTTVVGGGGRLPPPAATTAAVVGTGHGRSPHPDDGAGLLRAWRASTTTIPVVATAVAIQCRLDARAWAAWAAGSAPPGCWGPDAGG